MMYHYYCSQTKFAKVMFSQGGCGLWGVSVQRDLCPGGSLSMGGLCHGGTHPTGMHSCVRYGSLTFISKFCQRVF